MSISSSTTTEKLSLAPSLASIIRSHVAVHIGGEINPSAHFPAAESVVEDVEVKTSSVSEEVGEIEEVEAADTAVMVPVRPVLTDEESALADAAVVDIAEEPVSSPLAEETEVEVESDVVEVVEEVEAAQDVEEDDLDLDIDVSAYLTGNAGSTEVAEKPVEASVVETLTPEGEEESEEDLIETEDEDEDPDLDGFNPMKYLSGGSGNSQPEKKVQEAPAQPNVGVVAARQADPMSLLRELSTLSR